MGKNVYIKLSGYTCLCARLDQTQSRIKRVFTSAITSEMVLFYNILPKLILQAPPLFYLFLLSSFSLWKISRVGNTRFFKFRREIVKYISSPRESNYFAYFCVQKCRSPSAFMQTFFSRRVHFNYHPFSSWIVKTLLMHLSWSHLGFKHLLLSEFPRVHCHLEKPHLIR